MARKRKRAFASDAERAAHDARVDEHLRLSNELIDRHFEERGEKRPADSLEYANRLIDASFARSGETRPADSLKYVEQVLARKAERDQRL
jgi:hypothetical protein